MALVNLSTNLKSLRFGNDRRDGASSGQPYVTSPIPTGFIGGGLGDEDFLLRGGSLLPAQVTRDVSRLSKMFFDFKSPNGTLFTAKQNVLSASGVDIKAGKGKNQILNNGVYLPTSTLLQAAANPLGGHLVKQGINPFVDNSESAAAGDFGSGLEGFINLTLNGAGLLGQNLPLSNSTYWTTDASKERVRKTISSRLVSFTNDFITNDSRAEDVLYKYSGGPGSTLGVGSTQILLSKNRTGVNNPILNQTGFFINNNKTIPGPPSTGDRNIGREDYSVFKGKNPTWRGAKILGVSVSQIYKDITGEDINQDKYKTWNNTNAPLRDFQTSVFLKGSFTTNYLTPGLNNTLDYDQLLNAKDNGVNHKILQDYRKTVNFNALPSVDYTDSTKTSTGRVNLGDPGSRTLPRSSYTKGNGTALDAINAYPIYSTNTVGNGSTLGKNDYNDFVAFRIGVINNDDPSFTNYLHFRAIIDGMSDSYNADWGSQKFSGRAETLYNYQGFDRSISLSWTVAAQSQEELIPMYQKLNYLASVCAPDYSSDGYMRGNLIKLTIGGYLYEQVGILKAITYTVPQESPWEISIKDDGGQDLELQELPMIIKVSGFQFIPIQDFVPQVQKNTFAGLEDKIMSNGKVATTNGTTPISKAQLSEFGEQRYISLSRGLRKKDNSYDGLNFNPRDRVEPIPPLTPRPIASINSEIEDIIQTQPSL
tara:strand:+ start:275 stop:2392 length:2118 start_codon:yes stop_codon:yes gene_type:complete